MCEDENVDRVAVAVALPGLWKKVIKMYISLKTADSSKENFLHLIFPKDYVTTHILMNLVYNNLKNI